MSGKWKKVIWMICMIELCVIHTASLIYLAICGYREWIIIFVLGTFIMSVFQWWGYRRFTKECVRDLTMVEDEVLRDVFCKANMQAGNNKDVNHRIYVNPQIRIPFVMGFFRQSVIIPKNCTQTESLPFIFLHECYHIKGHDTLYKYVMLVCNCFLWFHPLAYFIRYISYRDIEVSCDETVVQGKSKEERYQYGKFLLESAGKQREKGKAYSAYWNDSKSILKCRIQAVMDEKRSWDKLAKIAVVFLLVEVLGLAVWFGKNIFQKYEEINAPVNEFEGTIAPSMYTDETIAKMLELTPVERDTYGWDFFDRYSRLYPENEMEDIVFDEESPWQYKIEAPAKFKNALSPAVQRFWYYMEEQEMFSSDSYEQNPMYTTYETVYSDLLAGDIEDAVWGIIWKKYVTDYTELNSYQNDYVYFVDTDANYVYFSMAVHIKMVEPYVFEVVGFTDLEETIKAYQGKYPEINLSDFPLVDITTNTTDDSFYSVVTQDNMLYLENKDGEQIEILVAKDYPYGLSNVYVDFPENENVGYLYGVVERVVFQEACVLYKTTDGGKNWEQVIMSENASQHSLTMDFDFWTNEIGYLAIYSSSGNEPRLLRTEDGGITWERVVFDEVPEYFSQAYAPEIRDGKLVLYVGMEEYSETKGEKAYYESTDDGKSWNYQKRVFRE